MCGIGAIVGDGARGAEGGAVQRMSGALRHRGPDAMGRLHKPGCALGHAPLSVLDPVGGRQPMEDASGRYTIVFNGEIYNHADLRASLEAEGADFRTRSDIEVRIEAYARWSEGRLGRLNEPCAFGIWDERDRTLFIARDRFGERPL